MKYLILKDSQKRTSCSKKELLRNLLKSMTNDLSIDIYTRNKAMHQLNSLPKNSSSSRIKNRCVLTGTSKSVSRKYKISRMKLRQYAMSGSIPGVLKSSW